MAELLIDYCGELQRLTPPARLTFGRAGALLIDDNPFLSRITGELYEKSDLWWIANRGSSIGLEVHDALTMSHVVLAPGASGPLPFDTNVIRFAAGGTTYELVARFDQPREWASESPVSATANATLAHLPLTPSQRQLVAALAEPRLRNPTDRQAPIPTNRQLAQRFDWELTKLNRKLDSICAKLDRHGVKGLRGGIDSLATDRRRRLVDFALTTGLVSLADLAELPTDP